MMLLERQGHRPMYEQIYETVKEQIERGVYQAGDRLPSIRRLAEENGVSKITVEQAYVQLATEGYIKAHHKAPYEVLPLATGMTENPAVQNQEELVSAYPTSSIRYQFATGAMDPEGFDFKRWKRYIGYVLRHAERLMTYGHVQGEWELREELASYLQSARGVVAPASRIIIASGTQQALRTVASVLRSQGRQKVALGHHSADFVRHTFQEYGFAVYVLDTNEAQWVDALYDLEVDVLYCTPSHDSRRGRVMTIQERQRILQWARDEQGYVIEDDYDSELRYYGKPVSSLQGLDREERVIYMGAPSKVLPPSIRISYFVLPHHLYEEFWTHRSWYSQGASVLEQLVWAQFMADGEWQKQIRRLRKHYLDKSKYFVSLLTSYLGPTYDVGAPEGGVYVWIRWHEGQAKYLQTLARTAGCDVKVVEPGDDVLVSFSGIATSELEAAVKTLAEAWKGA